MHAHVLTTAALAFSLTPRSFPKLTPRARPAVAFLEPEDNVLLSNLEDASVEKRWVTTASGLRYREIVKVSESKVVVAGDIVEIEYATSILSKSSKVLEATSGSRTFSFIFSQNDTLPMFDEMVQGMSVGSKRRVMVPTSSTTPNTEGDVTLQFDVELKSIPTGTDAIAFRVKRALPAVIRAAILLSFVPDVLRIFGVLPSGDMMSNPNFGAVDILAAPSGGATVDAANMWAAQGLQGLF